VSERGTTQQDGDQREILDLPTGLGQVYVATLQTRRVVVIGKVFRVQREREMRCRCITYSSERKRDAL